MQIATDKVVAIDYTLTDDQGQVLDTSEGEGPLHYLHGAQNIIPGLENALGGKSPGDALRVTILPDEGYGERNDELVQAVPRSDFEDVDDLELGMQFHVDDEGDDDEGEAIVTVVEIDDETVTLDGNHPLAGVTLHFDVTIREVRDATEEELAHGHVHGPGGHAH